MEMLGDMEECIQLHILEESQDFYGTYCLVHIAPAGATESTVPGQPSDLKRLQFEDDTALKLTPLYPTWGTCFPSTCNKTEVSGILSSFLKNLTNGTTSGVVPYCYSAQPKSLDALDITMIAIITLFLFVGIMATCTMQYSIPPLLKFSISANIKQWLENTKRGGRLGCLNGIRCLSTSWVLLFHCWSLIYHHSYIWNREYYNQIMSKPPLLMTPVVEGALSVDSFFVIGSCLLSYKLQKDLETNDGKFNPIAMLARRYIRLTPLLLFVIGFSATITPLLGTGQFWIELETLSLACRETSWSNLLYINNFYYAGNACLRNTWYLAVDFQFYVIAPTLVYVMWRWRKFGTYICMMLILCACVCTAAVTLNNQYSFINWQTQGNTYLYPWYRFGPYGIGQEFWLGLLCGRTLLDFEKRNFRVPSRLCVLGWIASSVIAWGIICVPWAAGWLSPNEVQISLTQAVYAGTFRTLWGLCVAWIILSCAQNSPSWINLFLSHPFFRVISPVTYAMYLFVGLPQLEHDRPKHPLYFDEFELTITFFGYLVLILGIGIACHLFVELPFAGLVEYISDVCTKFRNNRLGYNNL